MTVTNAEVPAHQEPSDLTSTLTKPEPGSALRETHEAITDLTADSTTAQHSTEGVRKGAVSVRQPNGFLTLSPDQTALTDDQRAAFRALGVNPGDPAAVAFVRRLVHVAQKWNLDPFSGEIHLVQRGKTWTRDGGETVDNRTWTIQTGIDGYRRRARDLSADPACPIRWIGKAKWFWSYGDDDDRSWVPVKDADTGDVVMEPVWWKAWPDSRGEPALAKAVIVVEDKVTGERRAEEFIANWKMFAAYEDEYEGTGRNRRKKVDEHGLPVRKLNTFWERGKAHMLGKVAEANVLRATFHGYFSGVYTNEEMHQADAEAARQVEETVAQHRRDAYRRAHEVADDVIAETGADGRADDIRAAALAAADDEMAPPVVPGRVELTDEQKDDFRHAADGYASQSPIFETADEPADPPTVGEVIVPAMAMTEADRLALLRCEVGWMNDELGERVDIAIARRARKTIDQMDSGELLGWVGPLRALTIVPHLRATDRGAMADAYTGFGPHFIGSPDVLCGLADPATDLQPQQHAPAVQEADAHPFDPREDDNTRCAECDSAADDPVHGGMVAALPD